MPLFAPRLHPDIDLVGLRQAFAAKGRVRIPVLLAPDDAMRLREHIVARTDWRQIINSGHKIFELDRATRAAMTEQQAGALDKAVMAGARAGFQYRYESLRVPDGIADRAADRTPLAAWARWLSGGEARELIRGITGFDDIAFADAQATAYAPGDLLTAHDDEVEGKARRVAYVLGLNSEWAAEWGGLLLFHDADDRVEGFVPSFNTLDLFAVPQPHSVSIVTNIAPHRRYSVTGWLRAQRQPD